MPWVAHIGKGTDSERFYLVDGVATKVDQSTGDLHSLEAAGFPVIPVTFDTIASRLIEPVPGDLGPSTAVPDVEPSDDDLPVASKEDTGTLQAEVPAAAEPAPPSPPKDDSPSETPSPNGSDGEGSSDETTAADPVAAPVSVVSGDDDWATRRSRGEV